MDRIRFEVITPEVPLLPQVGIYVNEQSLIELVRAVELHVGDPEIAGDYAWLWYTPEFADFPVRHLLGHPEPNFDDGAYAGKIAILDCPCGGPGCWPFLVRIQVTETTVAWSEFEQFRRDWHDDQLGPFVFDRGQYETALAQCETALAQYSAKRVPNTSLHATAATRRKTAPHQRSLHRSEPLLMRGAAAHLDRWAA